MEPTVVRIRRKGGVVVQDCDLYIGRAINMGGWSLKDSKWRNPFKKNKESSENILEKYEKHVRETGLINDIRELDGKRLGCWCTNSEENPDAYVCHGNVLVKLWRESFNSQ